MRLAHIRSATRLAGLRDEKPRAGCDCIAARGRDLDLVTRD